MDPSRVFSFGLIMPGNGKAQSGSQTRDEGQGGSGNTNRISRRKKKKKKRTGERRDTTHQCRVKEEQEGKSALKSPTAVRKPLLTFWTQMSTISSLASSGEGRAEGKKRDEAR